MSEKVPKKMLLLRRLDFSAVALLGLMLGNGACGGPSAVVVTGPPPTHQEVVDGLLAEGLTSADITVSRLEGRIRTQGFESTRADLDRWFCGPTATSPGRRNACRYFTWLGQGQPVAPRAPQSVAGVPARSAAVISEREVTDALVQEGFAESVTHLHRCQQFVVDDSSEGFTQCSDLYFCSMRGASRAITIGCDFLRDYARAYVPDPHVLNRPEQTLIASLTRGVTEQCAASFMDVPSTPLAGSQALQCAASFAQAVRTPMGGIPTPARRWERVLTYVLRFSAIGRASDDAWIAIAGAAATRIPQTSLDQLVHERGDGWRQHADVQHLSMCVDFCGASVQERAALNSWGAPQGTLEIFHGRLSLLARIPADPTAPTDQEVLDASQILDRARTYLDEHRDQLGSDYPQADQELLATNERTRQRLYESYSARSRDGLHARVDGIVQANLQEVPTADLPRMRQTLTEASGAIDSQLSTILPVFGSRAAVWEREMRTLRETCERQNGTIQAEIQVRANLANAVADYCSNEARIAALRDLERRQQEIDRRTGTRDVHQERQLAAAIISTTERRESLLANVRSMQPDFRASGACAEGR